MAGIPRTPSLDATRALWRDPYRYIGDECRRLDLDLFRTRLLLQDTICLSGREAAALFYDRDRFTRRRAAPEPVQATLFGKGGVQGMDGAAHRHRKVMFMSVMESGRINRLAELFHDEWQDAIEGWARRSRVVLYDEARVLLTRAVCRWAGVPLPDSEVPRRTRELSAQYDDAGSLPVRHLRSRRARRRSERWAAHLINVVRAGQHDADEDSPLRAIAMHRDVDGELLNTRIAAVELLNLLRPTVAVAVYIVFLGLSLELYPRCRQPLVSPDDGYAEMFIDEVRRHYPFFPFVAARTRESFVWRGCAFPKGVRVLLDLYGTNHDGRAWEAPGEFRPERFAQGADDRFSFVPQGGDEPHGNHRCAGEDIAVALMRVALDCLLSHMRYEVPEQDLRIDFSRLPALPGSHFLIQGVRPIPDAAK